MSALRTVAGAGYPRAGGVPWQKVAGTLRVPLLVGAWRSRWLLPGVALAALASIDTLYLRERAGVRADLNAVPGSRASVASDNASSSVTPAVGDAAGPRLELSTDRLDLGDGKPSEILRGELTLTNRGSSTASFSLIKHCGCSELSPLSGELLPGASETIHVGLQLADHANSEKNTSIEVKGGERETILGRCVVSARCPAPFRVTPAFISFGSLSAEELAGASHEIQIESVDGQWSLDAENLLIEHANDAFNVGFAHAADALGAAASTTVRVTLKRNLPPGDQYDMIELRLAGSEYVMRVSLHVSVAEAITVVPATVCFRRGPGAQTLQPVQLLVIDHRRDQRLGDLSLLDAPPGLRIEDLGDASPGRRRVRVHAGAATEAWPKESRAWLSGHGVKFAFKIVKPDSSEVR